MRVLLYLLLLFSFLLSLISAGIFSFFARQDGLAIQWVAVACSGLTAIFLLCQIVLLLLRQAPTSSESKDKEGATPGASL